MVIFTGLFYLNTTLINDSAGLLDSFPKLSVDFYNLPRLGFLGINSHAANSQDVYSFVYPNKKTKHPDLTPSAWLSTVGPAGLECIPLIMSLT